MPQQFLQEEWTWSTFAAHLRALSACFPFCILLVSAFAHMNVFPLCRLLGTRDKRREPKRKTKFKDIAADLDGDE